MPTTELVPTSVGTAGITWYPGGKHPRAVLVVGHGSATGVEAPDLQAIAGVLPRHGITVALVEQPWRVSGSWTSSRPAVLDTAWRELWPRVARDRLPLIAGGRSAGSQVACRTARDLGARAVLALAYPLNGPPDATCRP
jgi:predicted alpha/beta-hydrolase family hydrolase